MGDRKTLCPGTPQGPASVSLGVLKELIIVNMNMFKSSPHPPHSLCVHRHAYMRVAENQQVCTDTAGPVVGILDTFVWYTVPVPNLPSVWHPQF